MIAVVVDERCPYCGGTGKKRYGALRRGAAQARAAADVERDVFAMPLLSPEFVSQEDGMRALQNEPHWWEFRADGLRWCLDCSRKEGEVSVGNTARGVRKRRR